MQKLKDKLDTLFSEYIRLKYCNYDGFVKCVTCPYIENKKQPSAFRFWKDKMQNGHFMPRNKMNTRFEEKNCHPQCENCNLWINKTDMQVAYRRFMVDTYGEKITREIEDISMKTDLMSPLERELWYVEKIEYYKLKVAELKSEKGL